MWTTNGQRSISGTVMTLRCLILSGLMLAAAPLFALTPNWPAGTLRPDMLAQTRTGPVDCILAAPLPRLPGMRGHTHGLYAADIAVATGYVYATRVIESSGNPDLDNAMLNTLQQWRFRPRLIYKLVVPVEFHGHTAHLGR